MFTTLKIKSLSIFLTAILCLLSGFTNKLQAQSTPKFRAIAFYSASFDVAHISFAHEANKWFAQQAEKYNFQYDSTKNWDNLNPTFLSKYQIVFFLDDQPASAAQRTAFQQYMQNGGGFIGFHVCAFNTNPATWDWYFNQFLATGSFKTNTWGPTTAILKVEDNTHPATVGLPAKFTSAVSEWYGWTKDLRSNSNIRILCSVDPSSFPLGSDPNQSWYNGYYPIVWANKNYKMLYCNFGHNDIDYSKNNATKSFTFSNATQNNIVLNGMFSIAGGSAPVFDIPGTVQVEGYDVMNGIQKQTTTDTDGGQNIGYIDAGDWLDYKVNVKTTGVYTVQYRVASIAGGGTIQLKSGTTTLATTNVPATNGWQTWTTVTTTVNLTAGAQTLRLQAGTGGYNINWAKFTTNTAPTVTLTSPTAGSTFSAPATVTLSANAADTDGSIAKVEFYQGTTLLNSDATAPYTYNWTGVTTGTYAITAKAYDNSNAVTTSSAVPITVNNPNVAPTVTLTSPTAGSAFTAPATITLAANAADSEGSVSKVEFYEGTTLLNSDATAPYTYSWTGIATGTYLITAKAYDNSAAVTTSSSVSITVKNPNVVPTVTLTSPTTGSTFTSPATVTIAANASDSDGSIAKVEFYEGTTLLDTDKTAPYNYDWNNVVAGTYIIKVIATDNEGAKNEAQIAIEVKAVTTEVIDKSVLQNARPYPNPTSGLLHLPENTQSVTLYDLSGKAITNYLNTIELDLTTYKTGIYFINLQTANQSAFYKIVKE